MADLKRGTIDKMARNNKAFTLSDDPNSWFSVFDVSSMNGATRGAEVEFSYASKVNGGQTYNNIRGVVRVVNPGAPEAAGTNVISMASNQPQQQTFGTVSLTRDRSIARQNAMNVSAQLLLSLNCDKMNPQDMIDQALAMAMRIEEYTTGDLDQMEVKKAMEKDPDTESELSIEEMYATTGASAS